MPHTQTPETNEAKESIENSDFLNFLNGAANHEAKLLSLAVMLSHPEKWYTTASISRELHQRQGEHLVWDMSPQTAFSYCKESLEPIGAVLKGNIKGKRLHEVTAYKANEDNLKHNLALTGFLLDWSLRYPDLSLQRVLGNTASVGSVRSPQVRYQIYLDLLTTGDIPAIEDIGQSLEGAGYVNDDSITRQVQVLRDTGIVDLHSKQMDYNPELKIIDPEFKHVVLKLEDRTPITQAVYAAIKRLGADTTISLGNLIDNIGESNPALDKAEIRTKLVTAISSGKGYTGLEIVPGTAVPQHQFSSVEFTDSAEAAILDLCQGLEALRDGYDLKKYASLASKLIQDPGTFSKLMEKAMKNSASYLASEGRAQLNDRIIKIVRQTGAITTRQVMETLKETSDRSIGLDSVRNVLNGLVKEGVLSVGNGEGPRRAKQTRIYSILQ